MLENKKIRDIHATRYIMSWVRMNGNLSKRAGDSDFEEWLKSLNLDEDEIEQIIEISRSGKLELEMSAGRFLFLQDLEAKKNNRMK